MTPLMLLRGMEAGSLGGEGRRQEWRGLEEVSRTLVAAVIAAEDAHFCSHDGFDWEAIERAYQRNQEGQRLRGGSTISQQTAKNVFLWPERSWLRKGLEAWLTLLIEAFWPKWRILEVYLNVVEWADGVYGAEAAARHHFGKSAANLNRSEAARLALVLPAPRRWNPARPPTSTLLRRRLSTILEGIAAVQEQGLDRCAIK
jgi:monofunctional biosynthetic peptidoglycan transglycosylase